MSRSLFLVSTRVVLSGAKEECLDGTNVKVSPATLHTLVADNTFTHIL